MFFLSTHSDGNGLRQTRLPKEIYFICRKFSQQRKENEKKHKKIREK